MELRPIKTLEDYEAALVEIEGLMNAQLGTPEGDRLEILATLIEAYEKEHYPIEPAEPLKEDAWDVLKSLIGTVQMPADWSLEHDHYLYGTPKRYSKEDDA